MDMKISIKKRTLDTSKWTQEYRHARVVAALAARGISLSERDKDMDQMLSFLAVVGYSIPSILAAWLGGNGVSIIRKGLRDGLLTKQPNSIRSSKKAKRGCTPIVGIDLILLSRFGFERVRHMTNVSQDRVKAPSNRYVRHDLLAQIRALKIKEKLRTWENDFQLFSKKNQMNSALIRPGTMHKFVPDLWFEYTQNDKVLGVFVEIERSAKSNEELQKFGQKLNLLTNFGQVLVFFERESSKNAFLNRGFPHWVTYNLHSIEKCSSRGIHFSVVTPENLAFLP